MTEERRKTIDWWVDLSTRILFPVFLIALMVFAVTMVRPLLHEPRVSQSVYEALWRDYQRCMEQPTQPSGR